VEAFQSNWDPNNPNANVLAKLGKNNILYWDERRRELESAQEWNLGEDATIEESLAFVEAATKMNEAAEDLTGNGATTVKDAGDKMEGAADKLDGLPDEMVKAIQKIGFTFTLEGQPLVAYVSSQLAGELANRRYVP
jgi:hypothetical protein